ncbi:hypothetical protein BMS3Abin04_01622 [bacterium BMS3Abin04]|nr:hypothetical protein BMS3Abin04_01622 [bacterium BMS3Abin04]
MKNNKEKILNYLSDQMSEEEKRKFESELNSSSELKREFNEAKEKLDKFSFNDDVYLEEDYFGNLLPKTRAKLEKDDVPFYKKKIAFAVPVLAAIIIVLIFIVDGTNTSSKEHFITFNDLENILYTNDNLNEKLASQLWEEKLDGNYQIPLSEINKYYNLSIEDLVNEGSIDYLNNDFPYLNSYDLYNKLKEKDIEKFYKSLMNKKIL